MGCQGDQTIQGQRHPSTQDPWETSKKDQWRDNEHSQQHSGIREYTMRRIQLSPQGTAPYMGGRRTKGHHHRLYQSSLYGSGQAMLSHGHSEPEGIDDGVRSNVLYGCDEAVPSP